MIKKKVKRVQLLSRFNNKKKILVVGEGDFSFSLSLAKAFGSASNITATSLDIREDLGRYYNNGKSNEEELKKLGCNMVRGVNVHSMTLDSRLARYDLIVFNFPHAGKHNKVMRGFMESAREMVKEEGGEIHVTCLTINPFNLSDMKALAKETGLRFIRKMQFSKWDLLDYYNKRKSEQSYSDHGFPFGSVTFMFQK